MKMIPWILASLLISASAPADERWLDRACGLARSDYAGRLHLLTVNLDRNSELVFALDCRDANSPTLVALKNTYRVTGEFDGVAPATLTFENDIVTMSAKSLGYAVKFMIPSEEIKWSEQVEERKDGQAPTSETKETNYGRRWVVLKEVMAPIGLPSGDAPGCLLITPRGSIEKSLESCRFSARALYLSRGALNNTSVMDPEFAYGQQYDYRGIFRTLSRIHH